MGVTPVQIGVTQVQVTQGAGNADGGDVKVAGQLGNGIGFQHREGAADFVALGVEPLVPVFFRGA
ncbi:hypothetical protein D3C80_1637210 [compost metagenome]